MSRAAVGAYKAFVVVFTSTRNDYEEIHKAPAGAFNIIHFQTLIPFHPPFGLPQLR